MGCGPFGATCAYNRPPLTEVTWGLFGGLVKRMPGYHR